MSLFLTNNSFTSISQLMMLICPGEHWTLPKGWIAPMSVSAQYQDLPIDCQLRPENSFLLTRLPRPWPALEWLQCLSQVVHLSPRSLLFPTLMPSQDFFIENINLSLNHFICRDDEELFQIDFQIQILKVECKCIPFFAQLANCNSWSWEYY